MAPIPSASRLVNCTQLKENAIRSPTRPSGEIENMAAHSGLYSAIMARRSTRRYDRRPLAPSVLGQVGDIVASTRPLVAENQFTALLRHASPGIDLVKDFGGYGRILNPPHYVVPYVHGERCQLAEAGYRLEQIAVRLTALGIGSCFIGALPRESQVRALYNLPNDARVAALLTLGWPSTSVGGRTTNQLLRLVAGADRRLPVNRIFFDGSFGSPALPPSTIAPLVEAARRAPSAVNAQPWRFLWLDEQLYVFVTRRNRRYLRDAQQEYRFHDVGAAMANITLMMEAMNMKVSWAIIGEGQLDVPSHPSDLEPIACLATDQAR